MKIHGPCNWLHQYLWMDTQSLCGNIIHTLVEHCQSQQHHTMLWGLHSSSTLAGVLSTLCVDKASPQQTGYAGRTSKESLIQRDSTALNPGMLQKFEEAIMTTRVHTMTTYGGEWFLRHQHQEAQQQLQAQLIKTGKDHGTMSCLILLPHVLWCRRNIIAHYALVVPEDNSRSQI